MENINTAVLHVKALGKLWPVEFHTDDWGDFYYVKIGANSFIADTVPELQEIINDVVYSK